MAKLVKCKSGLMGERCQLRESYSSFEDFEYYSDVYNLAERLGYNSAQETWDANPIVEFSVEPSDFRKISQS